MLGRGPLRFFLLALLVIVPFLFIVIRTTSFPAEWTSAIKSSTDAFLPKSTGSPASTGDRTGRPGTPDITSEEDVLASIDRVFPPATQEGSSLPASSPQVAEQSIGHSSDAPFNPKNRLMPDHYIYNDIENVHRTVYSISTADRAYFQIVLGLKSNAYNPNIIPHRTLNDTYIVVAQESEHSVEQSVWFAESVCSARFQNGRLECVKAPSILPIAATFGDKCHDNLAYFGYNVGPHDARLFYGPTKPLVVYGSNSAYTCFGQFVQDFRLLLDWGFDWNIPKEFKSGTEIQRPGKYGPIEKNFFLFWDEEGDMYAHFDLIPSRSFAKLNDDGSVGKNLAPAAKDERCLSALMPAVAAESESVHQATNSLSITMCKRSDKHCEPNNKNTFVFTIFQHKSFYSFHSNYEPYVMIFSQAAPFSVQAISQKPIWIHGRGLPGTRPEWIPPEREWEQTEMFYITSMAWATQGQTYHGYLDDPLFLAFGIEDSKTGGIDILASNLFQDLAYCSAV